MKVDVIQIEQATFKKFAWWSNWIDISIIDAEHNCYLLQMKLSRTNKKKFKLIGISKPMAPFSFIWFGTNQVGDLTQMKSDKGNAK